MDARVALKFKLDNPIVFARSITREEIVQLFNGTEIIIEDQVRVSKKSDNAEITVPQDTIYNRAYCFYIASAMAYFGLDTSDEIRPEYRNCAKVFAGHFQ